MSAVYEPQSPRISVRHKCKFNFNDIIVPFPLVKLLRTVSPHFHILPLSLSLTFSLSLSLSLSFFYLFDRERECVCVCVHGVICVVCVFSDYYWDFVS